MPFRMIWGDLARMDTDAVVNAAYPTLRGGDSGVHGAICRAAGREALEAALQKTGWCDVGGAVATPGFGLRARGIIHAVAPTWRGGRDSEAALLKQTYQSALALAAQNGYRSVAFPPLGADDFGFPLDVAVSVAVEAIGAYLLADGELDVTLVLAAGAPVRLPTPLRGALAAYVRENAADVPPDTPLRPAFAHETFVPAQEEPYDAGALPAWLCDFVAPQRSPQQATAAETPPAKPAGIVQQTSPTERDGGSPATTPNPPRKGIGAALGTALTVGGGVLLGMLKLVAAPLRLLGRVFRRLTEHLRGDVYEDTFDELGEQTENRAPTSALEQARIEDLFRAHEQGLHYDRHAPEARPARPQGPAAGDWDEAADTWPLTGETDGQADGGSFAADGATHTDEGPFAAGIDEDAGKGAFSAHPSDATTGHPPIPAARTPIDLGADAPSSRAAAREAYTPPQADTALPAWLTRRSGPAATSSSPLRPSSVGAAPPKASAPMAMPPPSAPPPVRLASRAAPSGGIAGAARARTLQEAVAHAGDTFSQAVLYLIDARGLSDVQVYKRANLDRKLFSKLRSGKGYQPSKQTAVALCIALALDLDDALDLLARAGYTLAACNKADLIAAFFIEHGIFDIFQLNEALFAYGQPCLGA